MKRMLSLAAIAMLLSLGSAFAQEQTIQENTNKEEIKKVEVMNNTPTWEQKYNANYMTLGIQALPIKDGYMAAPAITFGRLFRENQHAVDVSAYYAFGEKDKAGTHAYGYSYSLAKIMYKYFFPLTNNNKSLSVGVGGNVGGYFTSENEFHGMLAHANCGYNMQIGQKLQSFVNFDVGVPTFKFSTSANSGMPIYTVGVGLGY